MSGASDSTASKTAGFHVADDLARAIARLKSFHDGEAGVIETVACGKAALPALQDVLRTREPSGLYETRRRAVRALAQLGAYDVLLDYLRLSQVRKIADPVEQIGEEAVVNAAARALIDSHDARAEPLLLGFMRDWPKAGVVQALGELRCEEALPYFMRSLAEDFTRRAAEAAIRTLGLQAWPALVEAATSRAPSDEEESVSSVRRRRSALNLLVEFGRSIDSDGAVLRALMDDKDPSIAISACRLFLLGGSRSDKIVAVYSLIDLLSLEDFFMEEEIKRCLIEHFNVAKEIIERVLRQSETNPGSPQVRTSRILNQVATRANIRHA